MPKRATTPENVLSTLDWIKSTVELITLLGPAPLIRGEDSDRFFEIYDRFRSAVQPRDFIEEIWIRDIADMTWECLRARRFKAKLVDSATPEIVDRAIKSIGWSDEARKTIIDAWKKGEKNSHQAILAAVEKAGRDMKVIEADAFGRQMSHIGKMDQLIANTEARRNLAIQQIDKRRDLQARVRAATAEIEDAEFVEVETATEMSK